jgi:hypothetical protein
MQVNTTKQQTLHNNSPTKHKPSVNKSNNINTEMEDEYEDDTDERTEDEYTADEYTEEKFTEDENQVGSLQDDKMCKGNQAAEIEAEVEKAIEEHAEQIS